jgi:hypothetical protein
VDQDEFGGRVMKVRSLAELPEKHRCLKCGADKPVSQMVVVRLRKEGLFYLRPRCKDCHNEFERGRRREWKRTYLRRWRRWNAELNESYWRQRNSEKRVEINARAYKRFRRHHAAILIQGRLRRRLGMKVTLTEAKRLAKTYGICYPTRFGLTAWGLKECERIRSNMRRIGKHLDPVEIRMMVYADGHFKKPHLQKMPYQRASKMLSDWHANKRSEAA